MEFLKKNYGWGVLVLVVAIIITGIHDNNIQKQAESFSLLKDVGARSESPYYYGASMKCMTLMLREISYFVSKNPDELKKAMVWDTKNYGENADFTSVSQIPMIPGTNFGRSGQFLIDIENLTITEIVSFNPVEFRNCGALRVEGNSWKRPFTNYNVLSATQNNWEGEFYQGGTPPNIRDLLDPEKQKKKNQILAKKWLF